MEQEKILQAVEWLRREKMWRHPNEPTDYIDTAIACMEKQLQIVHCGE